MLCASLIAIVGLMTPVGTLGHTSSERNGLAPTSAQTQTCDTMYVGPPGGAWNNANNWSPVIPDGTMTVCFPPDTDTGAPSIPALHCSGLSCPCTAGPGGGRTGRTGGQAASGTTRAQFRARSASDGSGGPPLAGARGSDRICTADSVAACCLGSTCIETDAQDCNDQGGYFLYGMVVCTEETCATGACCEDTPSCDDDDGTGGPMDEALCDSRGGIYVGGALCDETDPCERFRIPEGFEIIEVAPGTEMQARRHPRLNNCAQIVFNMESEPYSTGFSDEIYLYDNGLLTRLTDNDVNDVFPDINDNGVIVWNSGADGFGGGEITMLRDGELTVLGDGCSPSINNLGHVAWQFIEHQTCAYESSIYFYDGSTAERIFDDGLSNQSVRINDNDQMVWTRYYHCDDPWTSEIVLYAAGSASALPSNSDWPQGPDLDNNGRVAWASSYGIEVWEEDVTTTLLEANTASPALNDRGDIAYQFKTTYTAWQVWLFSDGQFYQISNPAEITSIVNGSADTNELGEIAWRWDVGASIPSGIRFMRRIRNGDIDFDGDVDLDDFIPLPGCVTGPVPTDGLCQCRFFDMDHDRDVDDDDIDSFLAVYAGPLDDCNDNQTIDLYELLDGTSFDCNLNGILDECDILVGTCDDENDNGIPDECECPPLDAPQPEPGATPKTRYLSLIPGNTDFSIGLRVTLTNLPPPFDGYNGREMWIGEPHTVTESSGSSQDTPLPTFMAAELQCQAYFTDWDPGRVVHVYGSAVVPGATYTIDATAEGCDPALTGAFSDPLTVTTSLWGDIVGNCETTPCTPPDGTVDFVDIAAMVDKFKNLPGAPIKARTDLAGDVPDRIIDFVDISNDVDAFKGFTYPFNGPDFAGCP